MHSVCPSNFVQTIVFKRSWDDCMSPWAFENNNLIMKNFGEEGANSQYEGFEN